METEVEVVRPLDQVCGVGVTVGDGVGKVAQQGGYSRHCLLAPDRRLRRLVLDSMLCTQTACMYAFMHERHGVECVV